MSDRSLQELFEAFGLTDLESRIYLSLLNKPSQTILEISRNLNLPRTSIYDNTLKLIEKGLLEKELGYKTQKVKASPIELLESLIDKEKEKISQMQSAFKEIEKNVSEIMVPNMNTQVRYYHGVQGFQQMMWNTLSAKGDVVGYSQFGRVAVVGEKFALRHHNEMVERHLVDRVIANPDTELIQLLTSEERKTITGTYQIVRFLDAKKLYISGDTSIYNNVFSVCYWTKGEVVGVEIENPELVKIQKSIFEQMWKIAEPLGKYLKK